MSIYKETLDNGAVITREFEPSDTQTYEPKLKHYTRELNTIHIRDFEDIEFKDGKILNAKKEYSADTPNADVEESYTIKNGKLDGEYKYSFSRGPNDNFWIEANFKEGVLDGDFVMQSDTHVIRKGHYIKGVFEGEYNPKGYFDEAKWREANFQERIDNINAKCYQPAQKEDGRQPVEFNKNRLALLRQRLTKKINKVFGIGQNPAKGNSRTTNTGISY
jgi:hypothetical protein